MKLLSMKKQCKSARTFRCSVPSWVPSKRPEFWPPKSWTSRGWPIKKIIVPVQPGTAISVSTAEPRGSSNDITLPSISTSAPRLSGSFGSFGSFDSFGSFGPSSFGSSGTGSGSFSGRCLRRSQSRKRRPKLSSAWWFQNYWKPKTPNCNALIFYFCTSDPISCKIYGHVVRATQWPPLSVAPPRPWPSQVP